MINKTIESDSFDCGMPPVALIGAGSKGLHKEAMEKRAALFDDSVRDLKPVKGREYIHVITTGAGETYSANSNGDYFNETSRVHSLPFPKEGSEKELRLGGGLKEFHNKTYKQFGGVYKNHQNAMKKGTPVGGVTDAAYNDKMHRGELLLSVDSDACANELQKMAQEEPVFFSMACAVPHDICSVCGNKASTRKEYCEHLKHNMLALTKEGHQVYAINDTPVFHDISFVFRPADKIAIGLRRLSVLDKEASESIPVLESIPAKAFEYLYTDSAKQKLALIQKLAAIEKIIHAEIMPRHMGDVADAFREGSGFGDKTDEALKECHGCEKSLPDACAKSDVLLTLPQYAKACKGTVSPETLEEAESVLPEIYGELSRQSSESGLLSKALDENPCGKHTSLCRDAVMKLVDGNSLDERPVSIRVMKITITRPVRIIKKASLIKRASAEASMLAAEYAGYQLSYLKGKTDDKAALVVIANGVRGGAI